MFTLSRGRNARIPSIESFIDAITGYSTFYNEKYGTSGHLFEQRPWSTVVSEARFLDVLRYVELNPVRARMVEKAVDYRWSSAGAHCLGLADPILPVQEDHAIVGWQDWLSDLIYDPKIDEFIRKCTASGRPCGDDAFIHGLEELTGRRLQPGKPGRPWHKEEKNDALGFEDL
jgi:putative transposase